MGKAGKLLMALSAMLVASTTFAYDEASTIIKLIKGNEYKTRTSYIYGTGSGQTQTGRHTFEMVFRYGLPSTTSGGTESAILEQTATAVGGGGGEEPGNTSWYETSYIISAIHVGESGEVPIAQMGMQAKSSTLPARETVNYPVSANTMSTAAVPALTMNIADGEEVSIDYIGDSSQSLPVNSFINVMVRKVVKYHYYDTVALVWKTQITITYQRVKYGLAKRGAVYAASIDSRTCYGQPNLDGQYMADPNSDPRNVSFAGWVYKGGLFAGNMPWSTGDQSGLARIQLFFGEYLPDPLVRLSTLTCYYMGCPSTASNEVGIGAYLGQSATGPYYWSTKWAVTPRTTPFDPPDYTQDPFQVVNFTSSSTAQEYCNWSITRITSTSRTCYGATNNGFVLAMDGENSTYGPYWRYFASPAYQALFSSVQYLNDCAPRIWNIHALAEYTATTENTYTGTV